MTSTSGSVPICVSMSEFSLMGIGYPAAAMGTGCTSPPSRRGEDSRADGAAADAAGAAED
ncbi:hypothetical protein JCM10369A_17820 [Nocardioides pyridinolyticus]